MKLCRETDILLLVLYKYFYGTFARSFTIRFDNISFHKLTYTWLFTKREINNLKTELSIVGRSSLVMNQKETAFLVTPDCRNKLRGLIVKQIHVVAMIPDNIFETDLWQQHAWQQKRTKPMRGSSQYTSVFSYCIFSPLASLEKQQKRLAGTRSINDETTF